MNYIRILILSFLFISCNNDSSQRMSFGQMHGVLKKGKKMVHILNEEPTTINLDNLETVGSLRFSNDYIKDVKYIPLRKKGTPIGEISYVLIYEDRVFVLDTDQTSCVYIFDLEGNFIATAGERGQGPGEYLAPETISIVEGNPPLLAVCDRNLYMNFYSFNGDFIKKEKRFLGMFSIKRGDTNFYSSASGLLGINKEDYDFVVSRNDSLLYRGFEVYPLQRQSASSQFQLRINNDKLLFTPMLCDTTYHILSDSTYTPYIVFQYKNSIWKDAHLYKQRDPNALVKEEKLGYIQTPICETSQALSFQLMTRGIERPDKIMYNFCYYIKETGQTIKLSNDPKDNVSTDKIIPNQYSNPLNVYEDYFVGVLPPEFFDYYKELKKRGFTIKNKELEEIVDEGVVDQAIVLFKL